MRWRMELVNITSAIPKLNSLHQYQRERLQTDDEKTACRLRSDRIPTADRLHFEAHKAEATLVKLDATRQQKNWSISDGVKNYFCNQQTVDFKEKSSRG